MRERPEVTRLLEAVERGEPAAQDRLFDAVYDELKRIARSHVRRSGPALTLNPTTLLHEAWLKIARGEGPRPDGSAHFYNLLAQAMRQILVDLARKHASVKHATPPHRTELTEGMLSSEHSLEELIAVDAALERLRLCDEELAQLVEWHFFAGISFVEIAAARSVTERTVRRHWDMARAFLADAIGAGAAAS